jgi:hypothetical protein
MLKAATVVDKKRGSPERRLGEQFNQQVPCQKEIRTPTKVAKERGRGSSRTKERERTRVATLAFLRQRLLLLERVAQRGLHHVSVISMVLLIPAPLLHEMDPS